MFVTTELVPVLENDALAADDPAQNAIWILPKMGFGPKARVMDAILVTSGGQLADFGLHIGAYNTALLRENVKRWSGPAFHGQACTPEAIELLDPEEELVQKVLAEIQRRNPARGRDPKAPAPGPMPSTSAGGAGSPAAT